MDKFSEWNPARVMNWNLYPMAASSRWKPAMVESERCFFQLKDGEQLYASNFPGNSACTPSANSFASRKSGLEVSHHSKSAYGAYEIARAMALFSPERIPKNPSLVRSPVRNSRSRGSISLVSSAALSASVRAMINVG